jgi:hypothetical protein
MQDLRNWETWIHYRSVVEINVGAIFLALYPHDDRRFRRIIRVLSKSSLISFLSLDREERIIGCAVIEQVNLLLFPMTNHSHFDR